MICDVRKPYHGQRECLRLSRRNIIISVQDFYCSPALSKYFRGVIAHQIRQMYPVSPVVAKESVLKLAIVPYHALSVVNDYDRLGKVIECLPAYRNDILVHSGNILRDILVEYQGKYEQQGGAYENRRGTQKSGYVCGQSEKYPKHEREEYQQTQRGYIQLRQSFFHPYIIPFRVNFFPLLRRRAAKCTLYIENGGNYHRSAFRL